MTDVRNCFLARKKLDGGTDFRLFEENNFKLLGILEKNFESFNEVEFYVLRSYYF